MGKNSDFIVHIFDCVQLNGLRKIAKVARNAKIDMFLTSKNHMKRGAKLTFQIVYKFIF